MTPAQRHQAIAAGEDELRRGPVAWHGLEASDYCENSAEFRAGMFHASRILEQKNTREELTND